MFVVLLWAVSPLINVTSRHFSSSLFPTSGLHMDFPPSLEKLCLTVLCRDSPDLPLILHRYPGLLRCLPSIWDTTSESLMPGFSTYRRATQIIYFLISWGGHVSTTDNVCSYSVQIQWLQMFLLVCATVRITQPCQDVEGMSRKLLFSPSAARKVSPHPPPLSTLSWDRPACHQYASGALKKKSCLQTKINMSQTLSLRMSRTQAGKRMGYLETPLYMEHKLKTFIIVLNLTP